MDMISLDAIIERLQGHKGDYKKIAEATGLDYSWLTKFANGRCRNPGYEKVSTLYRYLAELEQEQAA